MKPPTRVWIENSEGEVVTKVEVDGYTVIDKLYLKSDVDEVNWSISPALPSELTLSTTGVISGKTKASIPETEFIFKATNSAGSSNSSFSLTVRGCSYGDYLYAKFYYRSRGTFVIRKDDKVYYNETLSQISNTDYPICIPRLSYEYEFSCGTYSNCYLYLVDEHDLYYLSSIIYEGETKKGSFEITPTKIPVISFPSLITAYDGESLNIKIPIDGVHGNLSVTPSLPKDVDITKGMFIMSGKVSKPLYETYTITTSNSIGTVSFSFILAVDVCPPGMTLMVINFRRRTVLEQWKVLNSQNEVLFDQTQEHLSNKHNICWTPGSYQFVMATRGETGGWDSSAGLSVNDEWGVLSEFRLPDNQREASRHFNFELSVPEKSEWLMNAGSVSGKWKSARFNDKKWLKGKDGSWGRFSSNTNVLYLRKKFNVNDVNKYTYIHLDVKRSNDCEVIVYVNEKKLIERTGESIDGYARSSFPVSILKSSTIVAVEIHRASHSPETSEIVFDLRATLVSSSCILQSLNGKALDPSGSSVVHSPDYAFDLDTHSYWQPESLPATLRYTFGNDALVVVNKAFIHLLKSDTPSSLRIEGVNKDNSTVVLYSMKSETFLRNGEEVMYFENSQPFHSYQFVFESSLEGRVFQVYDVRFYSCTDQSCKKKGSYSTSYPETTQYGKCPLMSVGMNQMHCEEGDEKVSWREDRSSCLKRIPSQGVAYIDWSFVLGNMTQSNWVHAESQMISLVTENLKVSEEEIEFILVRDISDSTTIQFNVLCRFTLEYEIGDYILKHLNLLIPHFNELVKKYIKIQADVTGWVEEVHLREPIQIGSIVTVCATAAIVLLLVGIGYLIRIRVSKKSQKPLKQLKKGEEVSLLESV